MIVSYDNKLKDATITATNENANNPVSNLTHNFLELPFYSTGNSSVITIEFDEDVDIDHVAYGYHNLNAMSIAFYDMLDVLLDTQVITIEDNESIGYFTKIEGVRKAIVTVSSLALLLYIGCISIGEYLDLPDFLAGPQNTKIINDSSFQSSGGQSSGNRKQNFNRYPLQFANISNTERGEMQAYTTFVQTSIPHFIDLYPDAHDEQPVFYGTIESKNIPLGKRGTSNFTYNASITYRESR